MRQTLNRQINPRVLVSFNTVQVTFVAQTAGEKKTETAQINC